MASPKLIISLCNNKNISVTFMLHIDIYIYIGINDHPKRMLFIMRPTEKRNRKTNVIKQNEATKTFQRKSSVEGVNE